MSQSSVGKTIYSKAMKKRNLRRLGSLALVLVLSSVVPVSLLAADCAAMEGCPMGMMSVSHCEPEAAISADCCVVKDDERAAPIAVRAATRAPSVGSTLTTSMSTVSLDRSASGSLQTVRDVEPGVPIYTLFSALLI